MENVIIIAVVVLIVALAGRYIYKAKKSGAKCIGCPAGGCSCGKDGASCGGCSGSCGWHKEEE